MDGNSVAGGMMPGMLGLEMPLHQHHQTPPPPNLQHQHQEQLMLFASQPTQSQAHHSDTDHNAAIASKHVYIFGGGGKGRPAPSSEDEPSSAFGEECSGGVDLGMTQHQPQRGVAASVSATPSPWQRMKWTDTMVKLLIMVVYCVGDDGGPEGSGGGHHHSKAAKKGGSSTAGGAAPCAGLQQQQQQQKKGKWKSVSRAMMEKGYYVSPQQCEDKFNDLNKRYKRVNDILGKGTACRVVENQALLDTMDNLSTKAKEEVRKLLNSKHLFFREMCAYHRSCAAAAAANAGGAGGGDPATLQAHHLQSCEALTPPSDVSTQLQQQRCYHPSDVGSGAFPARGYEVGAPVKLTTSIEKLSGQRDGADEDGMADDDDDDEDDEDDYGDEDDDLNEDEEHAWRAGAGGYHHSHHQRHHEEEEEDSKEFVQAGTSKRQRRSSSSSPLFPPSLSPTSLSSQQQQQLKVELAALTGTPEHQRQWLKWRAVELEERRVSFGRRALVLEKQRFKWLRFRENKEREMERSKLENERLSLENDRMLLLLRRREFDLVSHHGSNAGPGGDLHHSTTSPNGTPTTSAA